MRDVENISVFYKKQCQYNPQFSEGVPYSARSGKISTISEKGATTYGKFNNGIEFRNNNPGIRYPKQVLEFGIVERNLIHPTQKPVDLIAYLIRTYSNEGELVLDSCIGSGTTAIAAIREKRHFLGFELDKEYFDKANERINKELSEPKLF